MGRNSFDFQPALSQEMIRMDQLVSFDYHEVIWKVNRYFSDMFWPLNCWFKITYPFTQSKKIFCMDKKAAHINHSRNFPPDFLRSLVFFDWKEFFNPLSPVASDMTEDIVKFIFFWAKMQLQNKFDPHGDLHDSCKVCTMLSRKWRNLAESCVYDQCVRLFYPKRRFFCLSECVRNLKSTVHRSEHVWKISVYFPDDFMVIKRDKLIWFICLQSKIKSHCFRIIF